MSVRTGLDVWTSEGFGGLKGRTIGVVCNQATVNAGLEHILDLLMPLHRAGSLRIGAVFGPQHGPYGAQQDNMIEWEGGPDLRTGLTFHSLYGEQRKPTARSLAGLDLMVVDLPDIGSRYYTFTWTMSLCMEACGEAGVPVCVLDRPNPIGGVAVEGTVLDPQWASFVGLHPLPMRHGMTLGEIASYLCQSVYPQCNLSVVCAQGWQRGQFLDETGLPWVQPSPNMPAFDTALAYPGMCLLEGTTLSEGRGTTRPFETFGAPGVDGWELCAALNDLDLPGCRFRPICFEPTFQKHAGEVCRGGFIHVTDRRAFQPVRAAVAILHTLRRLFPGSFEWRLPPYEYEFEKLPFDILAGNAWLRESIENLDHLDLIAERMREECAAFAPALEGALLYR